MTQLAPLVIELTEAEEAELCAMMDKLHDWIDGMKSDGEDVGTVYAAILAYANAIQIGQREVMN